MSSNIYCPPVNSNFQLLSIWFIRVAKILLVPYSVITSMWFFQCPYHIYLHILHIWIWWCHLWICSQVLPDHRKLDQDIFYPFLGLFTEVPFCVSVKVPYVILLYLILIYPVYLLLNQIRFKLYCQFSRVGGFIIVSCCFLVLFWV